MANSNLPLSAANVARKFYAHSPPKGRPGITFTSPANPEGENGDLSIYGIASDREATAHYRIKYPLMYLAESGAKVRVDYVPSLEALDFRKVKRYKTVLISRCVDLHMFHALLEVCHRHDIVLIYDIDDYVHGVSEKSPAYPFYDPNTKVGIANLKASEECMTLADSVIFSTRELREQYGPLNSNTHVISNGLDLGFTERDWNKPPRDEWKILAAAQGCKVDESSLLFGWSGGVTHLADLEVLGNTVRRVLDTVPNAFFGMYCDPFLAAHVTVETWCLPQNKVVFLPPQNFNTYPRCLGYFDLGLAPLEDTVFNQCKSSLRLMELNAMSVPYVASDVAPYTRFHKESAGIGGALASTPDEFVDIIVGYLKSPAQLMARGIMGHCSVVENHHVGATSHILPYTLRISRTNRGSILKIPSAVALIDSAAW